MISKSDDRTVLILSLESKVSSPVPVAVHIDEGLRNDICSFWQIEDAKLELADVISNRGL